MSADSQIGSRALSGIIWKFGEKIGVQAAQFVIQIVLARLLLPEDYGIVGLLTIFISILDVFIQQGFTTALIQKKDADDLDISSVFWANIGLSLMCYGLCYLIAPAVSAFYSEPRLTVIMRILTLNVIIGAFSAVQYAIMMKRLEFRKSFLRGIVSVIFQGIIGVLLAYKGLGVWALVYSKLTATLVGTVIICMTVACRIELRFSFKRIRVLFQYSSKVLGTNLLNTVFNNIHSLIIGRFYNSAELGYYQRGQQIPQYLMSAVDGSICDVLYPTLSIMQNDKQRLKNTLRKSMKMSMYTVLPLMLGLLAVARPVTILLLTEKWILSVPYMQLSCIICCFWPMSARSHALNAIGKSNITLKLSIISKTLVLIFILLSVRFGIYSIMVSTILAQCIGFWITNYYVKKYLGYTYKELIGDLAPILLISFSMMIIVIGFGKLPIPGLLFKTVLQIAVGGGYYIASSIIGKLDCYYYLLDMMKRFVHKKGKR